ncbi:uncharacterized protein LOC121750962 [Salvia splendens]|nr:uncharacterized protein LOC121750962 [Salvia splendens]
MRACPPRSTDLYRIMLRFRPIAPKPVGDDAGSGTAEQNRRDLTGKRVKRKYVRIRARKSKRRPKSKGLDGGNLPSPPERSGVDDAPPPEDKTLTLQLLGERSEGEREICEIRAPESKGMRLRDEDRCSVATAADLRGYGSVMVTWIVMEGVTDKFAGVGLGSSDKEKMYNLERDTCPGFISDHRNNVIWVNSAYKRMVAEEKGFLVWLVVKEELPQFCPSFACRVRVTQQNAQWQKWNKIVPCDVWKMEFAGFAWKLDVNTALSLGF